GEGRCSSEVLGHRVTPVRVCAACDLGIRAVPAEQGLPSVPFLPPRVSGGPVVAPRCLDTRVPLTGSSNRRAPPVFFPHCHLALLHLARRPARLPPSRPRLPPRPHRT